MDTEDSRPTKRSRSSVACNRCKERRQKCDNAAPICTNCSKSGSTCAYKGGDHPAWYVESLELKVARLEKALNGGGNGCPTPSSSSSIHEATNRHDITPNRPQVGNSLPDQTEHTQPSFPSLSQTASGTFPPNHLGNALGFLSLCASSEPYYVGSSTGFSLANLVQAAVYDRLGTADAAQSSATSPVVSPEAVRNLPSGDDRPFSCHRPRPTTKPASLPNEELGQALISAYLNKVHTLYPFLDSRGLLAVHQARIDLAQSGSRECRSSVAKLHLVYGIGARHLQLLGTSRIAFDRTLPEAHFTAAAATLGDTFELRSTDSVEMLLLLALYSLHSPSGPGAWQLTGMAVRLCVELGLHRQGRSAISDPDTRQRRKSLFWSCLILERKVAVTLGRPFSLSDVDIDVEYPDGPISSLNGANADDAVTHGQLARLQRINSRIHALSTRTNNSVPLCFVHAVSIRTDLDTWRNGCPLDNDMLQLEYHKALLLLLQPFMTDLNRSPDLLRDCTQAAGAVCQAYKRIHQRRPAGFFLLELHDVLVAGITLIYSLWTNQNNNESFAVLRDLGACSTVLFLIAERWESAKRYRDAFEALVNATTACISQRSTNATFGLDTATLVPLDIGQDSQALFDTSLWGNDDSSTWKGMLGEITGTVEPGLQDWSWFTDPTFLTMQA